ncbi:MAG TPA: DUF1320 domain-containing protein [Rectinemataceae bacterium]|nr:DUF1320 domain-containing protein [Rectinemataceae bacterium]
MAYCTPQDLQSRYGTKVQKWNSDIEGALQKACDDASAEIDGYLSLAGATLPLAVVPPYLPGYAIDMAAYLLLVRSGFLAGSEGEEELSKRAAAARTFFEKWAEGRFDTGDRDGAALGDGRKQVRYTSGHKLDLRGYR